MTIRNLGIFLVSLMVAVGTLFAGGQQEPESETVELRILTRYAPRSADSAWAR